MSTETKKATTESIEQALLERIQTAVNNDSINIALTWIGNYHKFREAQNFITALEHSRFGEES